MNLTSTDPLRLGRRGSLGTVYSSLFSRVIVEMVSMRRQKKGREKASALGDYEIVCFNVIELHAAILVCNDERNLARASKQPSSVHVRPAVARGQRDRVNLELVEISPLL